MKRGLKKGYRFPTRKLDLVRRAKLLGVSKGHLSMVISGKRQSAALLLRLDKLMESEQKKKAKKGMV